MCPCCRGSLLPDPRYDVVRCIALAAANDVEDVAGGRFAARALLFDAPGAPPSRLGMPDVQARCISAAKVQCKQGLGYLTVLMRDRITDYGSISCCILGALDSC